MSSLILELQQKALDENISISTLLRYALVVSKKLKIQDFGNWISAELNGYQNSSINLPEYRKLTGECKAFNRISGYVPVVLDETCSAENMVTTANFSNPLPELEFLINQNSDNSISVAYPPNVESVLRKILEHGDSFKFSLSIGKSKIQVVLDNVKNTILNWALDLEQEGILGENMTFTVEEQQKAIEKSYINNYFYGDVSDSQIQQNSENCTQSTQY